MPDTNSKPTLSETDSKNRPPAQTQKPRSNADTWNFSVPKIRRPQSPRFGSLRSKAHGLILLAALLVGLGAGFAGGYWGSSVREDDDSVNSSLTAQKKVVTSQSQLISQIAKTVGPSVVSVDVISETVSADPFESLFGGGGSSQRESAGTGIILSTDGLLVTNRHVVPEGTTSVSVTLSDGTELDNVEVLDRTNENDSLDIAFLKITDAKGKKLTPAVLGNSSEMQVGDAVVAIGNALGQFQNTVTSGIVSGFGRSVQAGGAGGEAENLDDLFQTDAAINEGNSGGPLVNLNGEVIGINTAVAAGSAQNIGFAIPIDDITGLINQVKKTGKIQRPYLGVRYVALTPDVASRYDLEPTSGAFILPATDSSAPSILPESPAEKAGLQPGDIISKIDNTKIDQSHSLTSLINKREVGDQISLTIIRDGKTIQARTNLQAIPKL